MTPTEGLAVYFSVGALCAVAYGFRVVAIDRRRASHKPMGVRSFLRRLVMVVLFWPIAVFIVGGDD